MSKAWIRAKRGEFARDVIRDFCSASQRLEEQFVHFEASGQVSFEVLRNLVGEEMNKGLLWRLKDTAHHLFRRNPGERLLGKFLDWSLGYIFHETMKLKEDAYQQQNYSPWFRELADSELPELERRFNNELLLVLDQTHESINREITRIRFIVNHCLEMFPHYLSDHRENAMLARFLFDQNEQVRTVFKERYNDLIRTVYGDNPEHMYVLAAQSLRQGGWLGEAERALGEAEALNPENPRVLGERNLLEEEQRMRNARRNSKAPAASA